METLLHTEDNENPPSQWGLIFLILLICVCLVFVCLLTGFGGFWGGAVNISVNVENVEDSGCSNQTDHPLKSFTETTQWPTIHFLENFYLTLLMSTILIYYVIDQSHKWVTKKKALMYFGGFMITVAFAVLWEVVEALIFTISNLMQYWGVPEDYIFYKFGSESIGDIILNDMIQACTAGAIAHCFVYFNVIKPVSWLLFNKRWYQVVGRALVWIIFGLSSFLGIFRKKMVDGVYFNFGFYVVLCLKIIGITILFIEDKWSFFLNEKIRRKNKQIQFDENYQIRKKDPLNQMDINKFYVLIYIMHIVLWICTGDLRAWGIFSSNVGALIVFFVFLIISYIITKNCKQPNDVII